LDKVTGRAANLLATFMLEQKQGTTSDTSTQVSVQNIGLLRLINDVAHPRTITDFTDDAGTPWGEDGQLLVVNFGSSYTTLTTSGNIELDGTHDFNPSTGTYMLFVYSPATNKWKQLSFIDSYQRNRGTWAQKGSNRPLGFMYMCTNEGTATAGEKPIFWNGTKWILATGTDAVGP
jgi:hypothetical protein